MKRCLIFNADDYGLSPGVCSGIRDAARGVVRSTTVMANLVTARDAAALETAGLAAGLHLNLTCGPPLTAGYPAELLRPDGTFDKARALEPATWSMPRHLAAVREEWLAQLARLRGLGVEPGHFDSHHHVHLLGPLFPTALELATGEGVALRVRSEQLPAARQAGIASPQALIEGYFGYNKTSRDWLLSLLNDVSGNVVEVMCHPGRVDDLLKQRSGYQMERSGELAVLGDAGLAAGLEALAWQICDFRVLQA